MKTIMLLLFLVICFAIGWNLKKFDRLYEVLKIIFTAALAIILLTAVGVMAYWKITSW